MWKEGTIGIPQPDGKNHVIHFWVKHFDEPSEEYGINGSRDLPQHSTYCI